MKKLKVLQLCHDYEDPFISVCSTYLKAFNDSEHEVHTVFLRGANSQFVVDAIGGHKVEFFELDKESLKGVKLFAISKVIAICRREKFDLVIAHRYKPIYLAGVASLFVNIRLVFGIAHEHDVFARLGRRLFLRFCRPRIRVAGVSQSVRRDILSRCPNPPGVNRIFSLPNCIDESNEPHILSREDARKFLGIPPQAYVYGTVGRLVRKKEQEIMIQGLQYSNQQDSLAVIIGGGPRLEHLEQLAEETGVSARVMFKGVVPQAYKYMKAFDAFVLPSGEKEAFGLVLLEAMMARVPIICSDSPGPAEVVDKTGLHFRHGDPEELGQRMVEMKNAAPEDLAASVEVAYQRLLSQYTTAAFRKRFWELPPLANIEESGSQTLVTHALNAIYHQPILSQSFKHSIYRKLRRRGVTPSEDFEMDFYGLKYRGNVVNEIDANVFFFGAFEKPMLHFLRDYLSVHPGVFVDVGANVGNHSLFMSQFATRVHSFEPFPPALDRLSLQVAGNGLQNVRIHNVALGSAPGKLPFFSPPEKSLGGGSFLETVAEKHGTRPTVDLEVVKGDDYFAAESILEFSAIKIDVEGYEVPVLTGLRATLADVRPLIIMEVTHGVNEVIKTTADIQHYLPENYHLMRLQNRHDFLFRKQSRDAKRTGRYTLHPLAAKIMTKRVDVVACPGEMLSSLPRVNIC